MDDDENQKMGVDTGGGGVDGLGDRWQSQQHEYRNNRSGRDEMSPGRSGNHGPRRDYGVGDCGYRCESDSTKRSLSPRRESPGRYIDDRRRKEFRQV